MPQLASRRISGWNRGRHTGGSAGISVAIKRKPFYAALAVAAEKPRGERASSELAGNLPRTKACPSNHTQSATCSVSHTGFWGSLSSTTAMRGPPDFKRTIWPDFIIRDYTYFLLMCNLFFSETADQMDGEFAIRRFSQIFWEGDRGGFFVRRSSRNSRSRFPLTASQEPLGVEPLWENPRLLPQKNLRKSALICG